MIIIVLKVELYLIQLEYIKDKNKNRVIKQKLKITIPVIYEYNTSQRAEMVWTYPEKGRGKITKIREEKYKRRAKNYLDGGNSWNDENGGGASLIC